MEKKYIVAGVLLALVLVLGMLFPRPDGSLVDKIVQIVKEQLGASPGPAVSSNYFSVGGIEFFNKRTFTASSSVVCSITNPWSSVAGRGTSTIDNLTVAINGGHSAAYEYTVSTSTSPYASSTVALVPKVSVAAGAASYSVWTPKHAASTTDAGGLTLNWANYLASSPFILDGGQEINVRVATSTGGNELFTGACNFSLRKL